jgi:Na+/H+-dicarboxylate symporter
MYIYIYIHMYLFVHVYIGMVAWRVKGSNSNYNKMLIDSIPIIFSNQTENSCKLNEIIKNCQNNDICNRNLTCLNLPCNSKKDPVCKYIYIYEYIHAFV